VIGQRTAHVIRDVIVRCVADWRVAVIALQSARIRSININTTILIIIIIIISSSVAGGA